MSSLKIYHFDTSKLEQCGLKSYYGINFVICFSTSYSYKNLIKLVSIEFKLVSIEFKLRGKSFLYSEYISSKLHNPNKIKCG